jgi:TonB-dependent starch-binding outer membrane protein SusC
MLLLLLFLPFAAFSQNLSLRVKNVSLAEAFRVIEKQSPYRFSYTNEALEGSRPVTITLTNEPLPAVLQQLFAGQPLAYRIDGYSIIIKPTKNQPPAPALIDVRGRVTDENGSPLAGVTIAVKGENRSTATDNLGQFLLKALNENAVLIASSIGYATQEIAVDGRQQLFLQLEILVSALDESVVIAYGTTTKRLATGSISKVTAAEIGRQPVSNPLATLQGRVPGLIVTQSNGYAGSAFSLQIRGQNSLLQGSDPLILIDGVPFATGNSAINQINNAGFQLSPFNTLNPADIESMEVLKDADATAIYGSRGANGVILITTKKGKAGKTKVGLNA